MDESAISTVKGMSDSELLFAVQEYDPEYRHMMEPASLPLLDMILEEIGRRGLER